MKEYKEYKEKSNDFFNKLIAEHTEEHEIIGNSRASHEKRMQKILELGAFDGKKILDIGCGLGSFLSFCHTRNIHPDYYGLDVNERMISASREKFPELKDRFRMIDILEEEMDLRFDYCISIGTLNLSMDKDLNYSMIFGLMDKMFHYSTKGFAISMTSILSKKKNEETFYYDPALIIQHISTYCNNFKIDHSFLPHDFVLYCYKNDFYNK